MENEKFGPAMAPKTKMVGVPPREVAVRPEPAKQVVYQVDEQRDRVIQVGFSTVIFRANEMLRDPYKIQLARDNHIELRER